MSFKRFADTSITLNYSDSDDLKNLEDIESSCDVCQRLSAAPGRFRTSMPEKDIVFNRVFRCDLMIINGNLLLYCVDKDIQFNAAAFLSGEKAENV